MNAPPHRLIQLDVTFINQETEQVHCEMHEWSLDKGEEFLGVCLVTGTEQNKKYIKAKEVKNP